MAGYGRCAKSATEARHEEKLCESFRNNVLVSRVEFNP